MSHTCSFACELGLLEGPPEGPWRTSEEWEDPYKLADAVHARLANLPIEDENSVILASYAILILHSERRGDFGWGLREQKQAQVANAINDSIMAWRNTKTENLVSGEKLRTWEDWIAAMGLLMPEATLLPYAPYPLQRMRREIRAISKLYSDGLRQPASKFWGELTERMPYLESGRLWESIRPITNVPPFTSTLSYSSSICLHQLVDERAIEFELVPDAQSVLRLKSPECVISHVKIGANIV